MKDTKKFFKITFTGIMIALMFVFSWTILGMVPIGTIASATTVFIPVVIGIIVLDDFRYTCILSFAFGLVSLIRALVPQGALDPLFVNPLVSILPRLIMGILTHLFYRFISHHIKNKTICGMLTGGIGAFTNTLFTIPALVLFNFSEIITMLGETSLITFIVTIVLTNMIPEIILGMIVCFAVMKIYNSINKVENDDYQDINENDNNLNNNN